MRQSASLIAVLSVLSAPAEATPASVPKRKPGHWQITTISPAVGMKTVETCITVHDGIVAPAEGRRDCTSPQVTHAGDQVIVNVSCKTPLGEERISLLYTGDFTTWYRAIGKMTFDPPSGGPPTIGVTIDARYIGPECPGSGALSGSSGALSGKRSQADMP